MPKNRMRRVIRKKQFENIERTCLNYRRSEEKITFQQTRWKSMNENKRLFEPAAILEDVFKNIKHEPLLKRDEFNAFYRHEINSVRGDDKMARLRFGLNHAFQGHPFKALLTGHRGVGKSTELTKLQFMIEEKYYVLRFSVPAELDPVNFRPFDILLLIMIGVAEKTQEILQENNSQKTLPSDLLDDIWNWFSQEKVTHVELNRISAGIEAGAGATGESIWARALGLFAYLRGEIKYSSERKTETVDYRLVRISSLIDLANRLLVKCNQLLQETLNKNWLVICEDFDKSVPIDKVIDFFISNSNILKSLQTHIISTIPVELAYSEQASPIPSCTPYCEPVRCKSLMGKDGSEFIHLWLIY